jgi:hypothetical protein
MTTEKHYQNREIDAKFEAVHGRFDSQDVTLKRIETQTTATNGKVKKIIIVIVLMIGVAIGQAGKEVLPILIKLFL